MQFAACLAVIGVAGVKLSHYGDAISDKTGLGGTWVGVMLLGTVTSLPELFTGISSVTIAQVPEIAVGDVLGSCVFNLALIGLLDLFYRRESVYSRANHGHIIGAGFGVILIGLTALALLWSVLGSVVLLGHIAVYTPLIFLMYGVALRSVFVYSQQTLSEYTRQEPDSYPDLSLSQVVVRYLAAAVLVVSVASWLPFVGETLAVQMHWHESFVGTLFIALATSVPEMVVTLAAVRIGAVDMAMGNLFGSNLFNILILAIDDVLYLPGALLEDVSATHALTALSATMMTGVAIIALLYKPRGRVLNSVAWASLAILAIFFFNSWAVYRLG
ncbi:MAG: hypothetical protein QGH58_06595 [Arenicellales bacterium]|nr:hypothetical protein [Arenicellales bacterium]MDP6791562.1 hypothetical protein [Arenicellales bacterium]MDP6917996.1 hypothetical protein [Arenicellales bacterium]